MLKQNDRKLNKNIRLYGCNFRSLQAAAEVYTGIILSDKQIEGIYKTSIQRGWMRENCYCVDPAKITSETFRAMGKDYRCLQVGYYDLSEKKWKNWQKKDILNIKNAVHFAIGHWETAVSPATGHFTLFDVNLNELFDPWDAAAGGSLGKKSIDRAYLYKII